MILEQVQQVLSGKKGMPISEIAERIPELCGREEAQGILHLLLRLDRRFEQSGNLWFSRVSVTDPTVWIVAATKEYFQKHSLKGELLDHLILAVVKATGEQSQRVQEVIMNTFQSLQGGKLILNKPKE